MLKNHLFIIFTLFIVLFHHLSAQSLDQYLYEPSTENPFGLANPDAPSQIKDFQPLIGESTCKSTARNQDQTWGDTIQMIWRWKYIGNGMAVQDETLKADGLHSGSIRQFIPDSNRWFVHYYSTGAPSTTLPSWEGAKKENGDIILYRPQKAPNGMEGFYKISFKEITDYSFSWLGEWINTSDTFSYPTWRIQCVKENAKRRE